MNSRCTLLFYHFSEKSGLKAVEPYYTQSSSAPNQKRKKVRHRLYALLWVLIPLAALLLVLVLRKGGVTWQEEARQTEETSGKPEAEKPSVEAFATSVTREDPVRTGGDVPIVEKKNAVKQQKTQEKKIPLDHAETGPESDAASKNGKEADEGREQDPQQRFRFEENLRRVQKLMSDNRPAMAERMADNLVKRNSSPRALSLAGSVKFFSGKYKQGEALWLRALDGGGEIRIKAAHAHGFVTRGCVGVLVIRKKLIQYDSISKSQHNFVIITGELVAASARGKQLLLSRRDKKGKIQRDLFLLDWSRDDHDVKRFSDFLGELFEEE
ncbi:MAG TPA: hypothetical protein PLS06_04875 [Proteiniphilum sp.]|nr:hypothetical protein [Proteiniphilum sp.]